MLENKIIIAITKDQKLIMKLLELCQQNKINVFFVDIVCICSTDIIKAAKENNAVVVIFFSSDCPLIHPKIIDKQPFSIILAIEINLIL